MAYYGDWPAYVSVAERQRNATEEVRKLQKKGQTISPIVVDGKMIARTFWGKAWCNNLERYSDYESRMPRGRSYVRNGSVVDLQIAAGKVTALVSGSALYKIEIAIRPLGRAQWKAIIKACAGNIGSLVELLKGSFSQSVMEILARQGKGLFPAPTEISLQCSCPDWAVMCKHVAAALYGVGARLDNDPEIFFKLRQVDQMELVAAGGKIGQAQPRSGKKTIKRANLSNVFGIDLDDVPASAAIVASRRATRNSSAKNQKKRTSSLK